MDNMQLSKVEIAKVREKFCVEHPDWDLSSDELVSRIFNGVRQKMAESFSMGLIYISEQFKFCCCDRSREGATKHLNGDIECNRCHKLRS
jgi:hypothetical protein